MAEVTTEMLQEYINNDGQFCPFCEDGDLDKSPMIIDWQENQATQEVHCSHCGKRWKDEYRLQLYNIDTEIY